MSDFILHSFKFEEGIDYMQVEGVVSPKFYGLVNPARSASLQFLQMLDANYRIISAGRSDDEAERNTDILANPEQIGTTDTWGPFIITKDDFATFMEKYLIDLNTWHITVHQEFIDSINELAAEEGNKVLFWR